MGGWRASSSSGSSRSGSSSGDQLVAVVRQTGAGRTSGVQVETRLAHVWTIADGKAVRWEGVPDPEAVLSDGG